MEPPATDFFRYLDRPLERWQRITIGLLAVPVLLSFLFPLWRISMEAPQYPKGLFMDIWSYDLTGGNGGHDIVEINMLNHYIGMHQIERDELADLDWMPFALGALALLCWRTAVLGNVRILIDMAIVAGYVALFAFGRFVYVLYQFGHELDPRAPIRVDGFQPVIIGSRKVANFMTHSYPQVGSVLIGLFVGGLWLLTLHGLWKGRRVALAARAAAGG
ncbi:MAG: hypothetical protein IPM29_07030 [Planctomycetes bacterium]|nr:hypothetical protein [Planctomycetota bacterium]